MIRTLPKARQAKSLTYGTHRKHLAEFGKQVVAVVRPRGSLRVVLNAEGWQFAVPAACDRVVVEIAVRHFQFGRQRCLVDRETVVLASDFHGPRLVVQHRLVGAPVPEPELESLGPARQGQQLVSQADPEYRHAAEHAADRFNGIVERFGVAGTVRKEYAVWIVLEHLLGGRTAGDYSHTAAQRPQVPRDVPFHPVIERDD